MPRYIIDISEDMHKMPKDCGECFLMRTSVNGQYCEITREDLYGDCWEGRGDECPIIEVADDSECRKRTKSELATMDRLARQMLESIDTLRRVEPSDA